MSKVKIIAHPETGKLFTPTSIEGWVKCQVRSEELISSNGVISVQKRTAFPLIQQAAAELMSNLKNGDVFPLQGKIVRKVTLEPQYPNQKKVVNPQTGEEMGYYQSYTFTTDMNAVDEIEQTKNTITAKQNTLVNSAFMEE